MNSVWIKPGFCLRYYTEYIIVCDDYADSTSLHVNLEAHSKGICNMIAITTNLWNALIANVQT